MADSKDKAAPKAAPKVKTGAKNKKRETNWEPAPVQMDALDWDTDDDEWFIPAHNEKGQSTSATFRLAPEMEREIEIVVSGHRFPYKTPGDFWRHAGYRLLYQLHRCDPTMPRHMLAAVETMKTILSDDTQRARTMESVELLARRIEYHRDQGNLPECLRIARICRAQLETCADGHQKTRLKDQIGKLMAPISRAWEAERAKAGVTLVRKATPTDISALPEPPVEDPDGDDE